MEMMTRILNTINDADVDAILAERENGRTGLNWRNSVVDLLKLLGLESGLRARRQLAEELGFDDEFTGSDEQDEWLHSRVMEKIRRRELG